MDSTESTMSFRKTRIAFSALGGVACLLMIGLWVRSYWWFDVFQFRPTSGTLLRATSQQGVIWFGHATPLLSNVPPIGLHFRADWHEDYPSNLSTLSKVFRWFARPNPYI